MRVKRSAAATDPGRRRRHNEDSYVCRPPLFAVADGVGGAQAGELASRLAATALQEDSGADGSDPRRRVDALVQEANRRVYERQTQDAAASGMGTTITVALVEGDAVWIGHVGDSRAYVIRAGALEQLTEDHSLVAELVRSGKLSPEEAETHPQRSVVTRALGSDPNVDVDTFQVEAEPGDLFLLCSDGLTSMVGDETILGEIDQNRGDLQAAAKALVRAANRGGGEDNITVVFFEVEAGDPQRGDEHTVALPPPQEQLNDEQDTLDEVDGVKPIAVEEKAPRDRGRRHPLRRGLVFATLILVALLAAAFVGWGLWRSHFVGAEPNGRVAVYQGVPWNVVGHVRLYRTVYVSPLLAAQLSQTERKKLFDHSLVTKSSALGEVHRYEREIGR